MKMQLLISIVVIAAFAGVIVMGMSGTASVAANDPRTMTAPGYLGDTHFSLYNTELELHSAVAWCSTASRTWYAMSQSNASGTSTIEASLYSYDEWTDAVTLLVEHGAGVISYVQLSADLRGNIFLYFVIEGQVNCFRLDRRNYTVWDDPSMWVFYSDISCAGILEL